MLYLCYLGHGVSSKEQNSDQDKVSSTFHTSLVNQLIYMGFFFYDLEFFKSCILKAQQGRQNFYIYFLIFGESIVSN